MGIINGNCAAGSPLRELPEHEFTIFECSPGYKFPPMKMRMMIQFMQTTVEKLGVIELEMGGTNVFRQGTGRQEKRWKRSFMLGTCLTIPPRMS